MSKIPDNIVSFMAVDNAGNVTNVSIADLVSQINVTTVSAQAAPASSKTPAPVAATIVNTETTVALGILADPNYIPVVNSSQDNLENSIAYQLNKKIGFNTKSPRYIIDARGDSINIGASKLLDGYRISGNLVASADVANNTLLIGDDIILNIVSVYSLLLKGLISTTVRDYDRVLIVDNDGLVFSRENNFLETINSLGGKAHTLLIGTSGTAPAYVDAIVGTGLSAVTNHTLNIPMASSSGVTAGLLSKTQYDIFNAKEPAITAGTTAQYFRGDKTFQPLNVAVIGSVLTGLTVTGTTVAATDTVLQAFGKLQNQVNSLAGSLIYEGTWNASTNTPTIVSSTGSSGNFYIVNVAGTTTINGISSWAVGDWIVFNGTIWEKIANNSVTSVNGFTGVVTLTSTNIAEGTNLYYLDSRARASISLTTTGTSGAATYSSSTGVLNIPIYQGGVTSFNTRTGAVTLTSGDVTSVLGYTPQTPLSGTGFVKISGTTISYDNSTYLTGNQSITLSGAVTGSGATSISTTLANGVVGIANLSATGTPSSTTYLRGDNTWASITAGVSSFNTRTGAITLTSGDVTTALGFTPLSTIPSLAQVCGVGSNATGFNITATAFFEPSDIRYKNVLGTNPNIDVSGIDVIKYIRTTHDKDRIRYGYSAQDAFDVCPDLVTDDGVSLTLNYTDLHTLKIMQLEKRVAELEAKLAK